MIDEMHSITEANKETGWWRNPESARRYRNVVRSGPEVEYSEEQLQFHCLSHSGHEAVVAYLEKLL